jgi:hypothetical protein
MNIDWASIVLDSSSSNEAWEFIFEKLLEISGETSSPVMLHNATVIPDRLLSEAAWKLWESYPGSANHTAAKLYDFCCGNQSTGKAVLIIDALSLRELPLILGGAEERDIKVDFVSVTGAECPSTTDAFAGSLKLPARKSLANNRKPGTFDLFSGECYTDVFSVPFEDCTVPPAANVFAWHSWLDDLIHVYKKLPDQVFKTASTVLQGDGFWKFVNKLRQGRKLVITSDHGYAVSKLFSSEVTDRDAVEILRKKFSASRYKPVEANWHRQFLPPIVLSHNNHDIVMGQRKWKVKGGFPHICHGGLSLLEVAVPFLELPAL